MQPKFVLFRLSTDLDCRFAVKTKLIMFQQLISLMTEFDEQLFVIINGFHCSTGDFIMWWVSDRWIWLPLYLTIAVSIFRRQSFLDAVLCLIAIGVAVTFADQLCASVIRPEIERLRPSCIDNPLSEIAHTVNGYHGGRFGFPSCHAANSFALASFLSLFYGTWKARCLIICWALLICWSRIYLGVHYPGDIAGGIVIGGICGCLMYYGWNLKKCRGSV